MVSSFKKSPSRQHHGQTAGTAGASTTTQGGPLGAEQVMKGGASNPSISEVQEPRPPGARTRPPGML